MNRILPEPVKAGILRRCPSCNKWFGLKLLPESEQNPGSTVKKYQCTACEAKFEFANTHPRNVL